MAPNLTSWGGQIFEDGGKYHMFMAEMLNHCGLFAWRTNSACVHATADTPEGPYTFSDVAVPQFCHNPQVYKYTKPDGGGTGYALFHIGMGTGAPVPKKCAPPGNRTGGGPGSDAGSGVKFVENPGGPRTVSISAADAQAMAAEEAAGTGARLHLSDSPYGPWIPHPGVTPDCNNPAPFQHPNGTWYLLCNSHTIYRAPTVTGNWTAVGSAYCSPAGLPGTYEDPFLYMDAQERWHIIFHVYNATFPCGACNSTLVSGHRFSEDGIHYMGSYVSPYTHTIERTDGTKMEVATRERPKMLLRDGVPTYLMTGTCGGCTTCPPGESVNCKYLHWDFTLVQQLNVDRAA